MITKDITIKKKSSKHNILSFKKKNIFSIKVDKSIEILIVPNPGEKNAHQNNVGIILEEDKISAYYAGGNMYASKKRFEPLT